MVFNFEKLYLDNLEIHLIILYKMSLLYLPYSCFSCYWLSIQTCYIVNLQHNPCVWLWIRSFFLSWLRTNVAFLFLLGWRSCYMSLNTLFFKATMIHLFNCEVLCRGCTFIGNHTSSCRRYVPLTQTHIEKKAVKNRC